MSFSALSLDMLRGVLPILLILVLTEFILARIIGRLSFLYAGNPILIATYQLGVFGVYAVSIFTLISIVLFSFTLLGGSDLFGRAYGALCLALVPITLLAFSYAYPLVILAVALAPLHLLRFKQHIGWAGFTSVLFIVTSFLAISLNVFLGKYSVLRWVGESTVILASITLYISFRGFGPINWWRRALSIIIPLGMLVIPQHFITIMPWVIRQVATFSLNFQLVMPTEVYAAALALYLATVFRLSNRSSLTRYGLLLLLLGGLPQWNANLLLLTFFGLVLTVISFTGRLERSGKA